MKTEFSLFRVKIGKHARALEWMQVLRDRRDECIDTLEREAMYYESVFKTEFNNRLYLAWFSVQGDVHASVHDSKHPIDKLHLEFWDECIEQEFKPIDMQHIVSFSPPAVEAAINKQDRLNPS